MADNAHGQDEAASHSARSTLSERDAAILDFERQWWLHAGAKEQAIRDRLACFGQCTAARE
jgi:hypothetical protein